MQLTSATLIGVKAGQSQAVLLSFWPFKKGQSGMLSVSGTYTQGTFSFSQSVTLL